MTRVEWGILAVAFVFFFLGRYWERNAALIESIKEDQERERYMSGRPR